MGVGVVGGVVIVSDGTSLGAGAGWVGTGLAVPGAAAMVDGTADGTQTGSAKETFGVGTDDGDTGRVPPEPWPAGRLPTSLQLTRRVTRPSSRKRWVRVPLSPNFDRRPLASWDGRLLAEERQLEGLPQGPGCQDQAEGASHHGHALAHVLDRRSFPQDRLGFPAKGRSAHPGLEEPERRCERPCGCQ